MSVDRSYIAENKTQLHPAPGPPRRPERRRAWRARLPAGWTVAAVLGHLAFWDQRAFILLEQWEKTGTAPAAIQRGRRRLDQ